MHRDLKPGNVGLQSGVVKLLDFGLAVGLHDPGQLTAEDAAASSQRDSPSPGAETSDADQERKPGRALEATHPD